MTYIVVGRFRRIHMVIPDEFDCVCRSYNFGITRLHQGRVHNQIGQETSMGMFEFDESIRNLTSRLTRSNIAVIGIYTYIACRKLLKSFNNTIGRHVDVVFAGSVVTKSHKFRTG